MPAGVRSAGSVQRAWSGAVMRLAVRASSQRGRGSTPNRHARLGSFSADRKLYVMVGTASSIRGEAAAAVAVASSAVSVVPAVSAATAVSALSVVPAVLAASAV